jgi:hypothetical protein
VRAMVCAAAPCLFDDAREAFRCGGFDRFYAVNAAAIRWPMTDVWVTGHPENLEQWQRVFLMTNRKLPEVVARHGAAGKNAHVDRSAPIYWPKQERMAITSTLFAVKVALDDGAGRVVVCGAPLDEGGGHIDQGAPQNHSYTRYRPAFIWARDNVFDGRVRGVSGYLAEHLGKVDTQWLMTSRSA